MLNPLAVATFLCMAATMTQAACRHNDGYLYVHASCVTRGTSDPQTVCERPRDKPSTKVAFLSPVIRDNSSNSIYPEQVFFDSLRLQYDVSENGHASGCYKSRQEAENQRRRHQAKLKRHDYRILNVSFGNT